METFVKEKEEFRNYEQGDITAAVKEHYHKMRSRQTYEYVQRMKKKYLTFERPMDIWDMMEKLNTLVDVSDPDLNLPNIIHLLQTSEGMRREGRPDWMQLCGLIHDLGKAMYLFGADEDGTSQAEQWGLVGDIFVVGCKLPDSCVYPEFNALNPDMQDPRYNTELGVYEAGCGLDNLELAWGHDEYLYQVLKNHKQNTIPAEGMVMIRYHSFYPWHTGGSYRQFMNAGDEKYLELIKDFNQYDLYTKSPVVPNYEELRPYYEPIVEKYLGKGPINW